MTTRKIKIDLFSKNPTIITGKWVFHEALKVIYKWTGANSTIDAKLPVDNKTYLPNDTVTVDTTFTANSIEEDTDVYYTFSGWDKTGTFIITTPTTITGSWTKKNKLSVTYSWTNAPDSVSSKLPTDNNKYMPNTTVTIDSTYNSSSIEEATDTYYQFSGWSKTGTFNITADTTITGSWTEKNKLSVTYSWTNAPANLSKNTPTDSNKYMPNDKVTVDTTYTNKSLAKIFDYTTTTISYKSGITWNSICYGNGKFVVVGNNKTNGGIDFAYSENISGPWTQGTINSSKNCYWMSVIYEKKQFVACSTDGYIAYSTDGINWSTKLINSNYNLLNIIYGASKYFMMGSDTTKSNTDLVGVYSSDGVSWTSYNLSNKINETYITPTNVVYGNGKFIFSAQLTDTIYYSTDGITWNSKDLGSDYSVKWMSAYYGNDRFVIAGDKGKYRYSKDGITWTTTSISNSTGSARYYHSISGGNGIFIIPGNAPFGTSTKSCVYFSTDLENWNFSFNYNPYNVFFVRDKFVEVGSSVDYTSIRNLYYQFSGWNKSDFNITTDTTITGSWSGKRWYECWDYDTNGINVRDWRAICYGNGKFIIMGKHQYYAYSTDGITWKEGLMPTNRTWTDVCYGNNKFACIAYNSNTFAYSSDGLSWTEVNTSTSGQWIGMTYGNGKFIAVLTYSTVFSYSTDGIKWTEGTLPSKKYWAKPFYGNGKYIILSSSSTYLYSTNGTSWTSGTISSTSRQWYTGIYADGKYIIVAFASNVIGYSTNGTNWTEKSIGTAACKWYSVVYGNGKWVAITYDSYAYALSDDGSSWTVYALSPGIYNFAMAYGNGKFVMSTNSNCTAKFEYMPSDLKVLS